MYVKRDIGKKFEKLFEIYNLIALVGARQAGKTTFLKHRMKTFESSYVLFDDPDAKELFDEDVKKFEMQYIEGHELTVLDEVQYCLGAGVKLKYLVDSGRNIWITSSSEILLSKEVLSYLVGRVSILRLYPFSFSEFLQAKGQKASTKKIMKRNVWEHMTYGGYPKVVLTKDIEMKKTILRDLYETMILKDIARTFSIGDIKSLEKLSRYLAINTSNLITYENVAQTLGITFPTLKKYLDAMEKSYLIVGVTPFFTNKTKELIKQPKIFFLDTGLRNIIANDFKTEPDGKVFENYVLSELTKLGFAPKYWKTKSGAEVDFILEIDGELIPLEAKITAKPPTIERSLRSFITNYKPKRMFVVFYEGKEATIRVNGCRVSFINIVNIEKITQTRP